MLTVLWYAFLGILFVLGLVAKVLTSSSLAVQVFDDGHVSSCLQNAELLP